MHDTFGPIPVSDREMETAIHISCAESSQVAGLIHIATSWSSQKYIDSLDRWFLFENLVITLHHKYLPSNFI